MNKPGAKRTPVGSYKHFKAADITQPERVKCLHPTCPITFENNYGNYILNYPELK